LLRWAISASYFANRGVELTDKHAHKHQKEGAGRGWEGRCEDGLRWQYASVRPSIASAYQRRTESAV
jgi:hypothetical protein